MRKPEPVRDWNFWPAPDLIWHYPSVINSPFSLSAWGYMIYKLLIIITHVADSAQIVYQCFQQTQSNTPKKYIIQMMSMKRLDYILNPYVYSHTNLQVFIHKPARILSLVGWLYPLVSRSKGCIGCTRTPSASFITLQNMQWKSCSD